jgi:hypothetical protein
MDSLQRLMCICHFQFINREKDWFEKSPAFKMAQSYIQDNWIKCKSGAWMHKVGDAVAVEFIHKLY